MTAATRAVCGAAYHPIKSCTECHRIDMRRRRARQRRATRPGGARYGFRGPECLECGGVRSAVRESGYTDDDQRIRRRVCLDCGQDCASIEIYVDPVLTSFWRLNGERMRRKREGDYRRKGKGAYRLLNRRATPDRIEVDVNVIRGGLAAATHCMRGHELTEDNIYVGPNGEYRECLTCRRKRQERRDAA